MYTKIKCAPWRPHATHTPLHDTSTYYIYIHVHVCTGIHTYIGPESIWRSKVCMQEVETSQIVCERRAVNLRSRRTPTIDVFLLSLLLLMLRRNVCFFFQCV